MSNENLKKYTIFLMVAISFAAAVMLVKNLYGVATINRSLLEDIEAHAYINTHHEATQGDIFKSRKVLAETLAKKNYFVPQQGKPKPPAIVAIVGNEALFGDKWYSVGDKVNGSEITKITLNGAVILWEGKEKEVLLPDISLPSGSSQNGSKARGERHGKVFKKQSGSSEGGERKKNKQARKEVKYDALMERMLSKIPEQYRDQAIARWNSMSDAEKEKAKEQFKKNN